MPVVDQAVQLRPYQHEAVKEFFARVDRAPRQLMSLPTGTGKSIILAYVAAVWPDTAEEFGMSPRVLWLTHAEELVWQAAQHITKATGEEPGIEKATRRASEPGLVDPPRVVIGSVATLVNESRRMEYDRDTFGLVLADEAHHAPAPGWLSILDYFQPSRCLGCTATTDRADQVSLGKVFDEVCYDYEIYDAIKDGWLAPIIQQHVEVEGLDFSTISPRAGDFTDEELAKIIEREKIIHAIAAPAAELAGDRQTLVFTPSVASAQMVAEVLPRYSKGGAAWISGTTPEEERKATVGKYLRGDIQWLVTCGCLLEGFDAPSTSCIVMARPTKSRMLYAQIAGRGLRGGPLCPVPGKKDCLLIDLVGNSGRHKLAGAVDLLGGKYCAEVVDHARQQCFEKEAAGKPSDPVEELEKAASMADELRSMRRREIVAKAITRRKTIDPFDLLDIPEREVAGWWDCKPPTEDQVRRLEEAGIKCEGDIDAARAKRLLEHLWTRRQAGLCTYKQARTLRAYGFDPDMGFEAAGKVMTQLAAGGWKRTPEINRAAAALKQEARFKKLRERTVRATILRGPNGGFLGLLCQMSNGAEDVVKSAEPARRLYRELRQREGIELVDQKTARNRV